MTFTAGNLCCASDACVMLDTTASESSASWDTIPHVTDISFTNRRPSQVQPTVVSEDPDRQRTFSIYPEDWAGKHYSEVVTFLKSKYPNAHITTQAEKESTCDMTFTRPVSFEEGDTHIIVVYNCHNNQIMGFFESPN